MSKENNLCPDLMFKINGLAMDAYRSAAQSVPPKKYTFNFQTNNPIPKEQLTQEMKADLVKLVDQITRTMQLVTQRCINEGVIDKDWKAQVNKTFTAARDVIEEMRNDGSELED